MLQKNHRHRFSINFRGVVADFTKFQTFWRDHAGHVVDFIIGDDIAIEVKSTDMVVEMHLKNIHRFAQEVSLQKRIVVSLDPAPRLLGDIEILPWKEFLMRLWSGEYISQ